MLRRHLPGAFRLVCIRDWAEPLSDSIETIDARPWALSGWFNKLRLFDQEVTGDEPFLYLDLSLVIMRSLEPLLTFAANEPVPLIAVRDWHYDSLNSCAMWIRPGPATQKVWDTYAAGIRFPTRLQSDQDYVNSVLRPVPGALSYFPDETIASYKVLRKLNRESSIRAREALERAVILKFHGEPKPHQLLDRSHALRLAMRGALRHPRNVRADWRFLEEDVRRNWR